MMRKQHFVFPDPSTADRTGLVSVTDRLDAEMILQAYRRGIFPWSEHPVRWYSPEPRSVFLRELIRLPRRVGRIMRKQRLRVTLDLAFADVIRACGLAHLDDGVWITQGFVDAYSELHRRGYAHSVEVWQEDRLVGGLYGVQLGGLFSGESMFHHVPNASKVAFAHLIGQLDVIGTVLIDCQVINEHTARLGAVCIHRHDYLALLALALQVRCLYAESKWQREPPLAAKRASDTELADDDETR